MDYKAVEQIVEDIQNMDKDRAKELKWRKQQLDIAKCHEFLNDYSQKEFPQRKKHNKKRTTKDTKLIPNENWDDTCWDFYHINLDAEKIIEQTKEEYGVVDCVKSEPSKKELKKEQKQKTRQQNKKIRRSFLSIDHDEICSVIVAGVSFIIFVIIAILCGLGYRTVQTVQLYGFHTLIYFAIMGAVSFAYLGISSFISKHLSANTNDILTGFMAIPGFFLFGTLLALFIVGDNMILSVGCSAPFILISLFLMIQRNEYMEFKQDYIKNHTQ